MAVFDMITCAPPEIIEQGDDINNKHFTIDTADMITVHEWIKFNPYIVTHAIHDGKCLGFFNVIPITVACAALFDEQRIKEEDLSIEHILPHEAMEHAQFAYLAAIAVDNADNYINRQCAAALVSNICDHFLNGYNVNNFKRLYANPTTFNGNHMVRKLGLNPVLSYKKLLTGNDIYAAEISPATIKQMTFLSQRYHRFVGSNPWQRKDT